jgi:hypothetical protein
MRLTLLSMIHVKRITSNVKRLSPDFFAKFAIQVYFEFYERGKIVKLFRRDC